MMASFQRRTGGTQQCFRSLSQSRPSPAAARPRLDGGEHGVMLVSKRTIDCLQSIDLMVATPPAMALPDGQITSDFQK
jgi:hypothetical protein